jgi:hypothetical protein
VNHRLFWSRLLENTCSESNENLTSKLANIEKQKANHSCSSFRSQSLSESSDVLVSMCSEKDVVATQTDYSGSKSKWPSCWSLATKTNFLRKTTGFLSKMKNLAVQPARKLEAWVSKIL